MHTVLNGIEGVIKKRSWIEEGRGPYAYDEDMREELWKIIEELLAAIKPLGPVRRSIKNCPRDTKIVNQLRAEVDQALSLSAAGEPEGELRTKLAEHI